MIDDILKIGALGALVLGAYFIYKKFMDVQNRISEDIYSTAQYLTTAPSVVGEDLWYNVADFFKPEGLSQYEESQWYSTFFEEVSNNFDSLSDLIDNITWWFE